MTAMTGCLLVTAVCFLLKRVPWVGRTAVGRLAGRSARATRRMWSSASTAPISAVPGTTEVYTTHNRNSSTRFYWDLVLSRLTRPALHCKSHPGKIWGQWSTSCHHDTVVGFISQFSCSSSSHSSLSHSLLKCPSR